ncbi:bifunctional Regulator of chromosome condensation [Babesia duncani]|uniref:Bifunctional Regulator of chromosome condensation n=1 Tax=Babesia duncani TaxID=323732 RepID=A0AAD9UP96_9APIC|nr:bifunctional Regulator of chromosome condensation [Babesia duncani]
MSNTNSPNTAIVGFDYDETEDVTPKNIEEVHANNDDLLYVDGLSGKEIVKCLYRRFLNSRHFTYFGNVLFYMLPNNLPELDDECSKYHYDNNHDVHLFAFLNEILDNIDNENETKQQKGRETFNMDAPLRQLSCAINGVHANEKCNKISSVFVLGNGSCSQHYVTQCAASYIAQACHIKGLEQSGEIFMNLKVVHLILDLFNDYSPNDKLFGSQMISYRFNFDESKQLSSIMLIPNWATDFSCTAVSHFHRHRMTLGYDQDDKGLYIRFPTIFYCILHAVIEQTHMGFISKCRLGSAEAAHILNLIPRHEQKNKSWFLAQFEQFVANFLRIGFTSVQVISIINVICAIVLFDVYSILRINVNEATMKGYDTDNGLDSDNGIPMQGNQKISIRNTDILALCFASLGIGLLTTPNSNLTSEEILLKMTFRNSENQTKYNFFASMLYIRLKHRIYHQINKFLVSPGTGSTRSSIYMHCNGGNFIKGTTPSNSSNDLPLFFSEDAMLRVAMSNFFGPGIADAGFGDWCNDEINKLVLPNGAMSKIVLASQKYTESSILDKSLLDDGVINVLHSWGNTKYDYKEILRLESTLYTLPNVFSKLFRYSHNEFISSLFHSRFSLHSSFGQCAAAISYYVFLRNVTSNVTSCHVVFCGKGAVRNEVTPIWDSEDFNRMLTLYMHPLPILDMVISQRDRSRVNVNLDTFLNSYMPLAFVSTRPGLHAAIAGAPKHERARLIFKILGANENSFEILVDRVCIRKSWHVKMLAAASYHIQRILKSVITIQVWWVGHNIFMIKSHLRKLMIRIQSHIRRLSHEKIKSAAVAGRNLSICFIGLVLTMCHLNITLTSYSQKTLQLLHSMEKRYHDKEFSYLQYAAATFIQANWRGALARRRLIKMRHQSFQNFAVVLVQSLIRRVLASVSFLDMHNPRILAATRIQACWRGYLVRCGFEKLKDLKLCLLSIVIKGARLRGIKEHFSFMLTRRKNECKNTQVKKLIMLQSNLPPAFIKVQNLVRMWFVRRQFVHLKKCLETLHGIAMTKLARIGYMEKVEAARRIQSWWRKGGSGTMQSSIFFSGYYLNMREAPALNLLRQELEQYNIYLFSFNAYRDIARVYPKMWAKLPLEYITYIRQVGRSIQEAGLGEHSGIVAIDFAVGGSHSLMLVTYSSGDTALYSWGFNDHGELARPGLTSGLGPLLGPIEFPQVDLDFPEIVTSPRYKIRITSIECGVDFSLALSTCGKLFSWGNNEQGQCGLGHRILVSLEPQSIPFDDVVAYIKAADYHSIVGCSGGIVYSFGNAFGSIIYSPHELSLLTSNSLCKDIYAIACGGRVTCLTSSRLDHAVYVYGILCPFRNLYSLENGILSLCTNGSFIAAIVRADVNYNSKQPKTKLFVWGQLRCILPADMVTGVTTRSALLNQFCEKFETKSKQRQFKGPVSGNVGRCCLVSYPVQVNLDFSPQSVACDGRQIITCSNDNLVYGIQNFELVTTSSGDIVSYDDVSITLSEVAKLKLNPVLYQFVNLPHENKNPHKIKVAYNRHSFSIGYTGI